MNRLLALAGALLGLSAAPAQQPVAADLLLAEAPAPKLSDYRLFLDRAAKQPNARVLAYALNTPLFSDYADKHRYLFVPAGQTINYRAEGVMEFPVGTTLVKTFATPDRFIETRLLIRKEAGWVAQPYVWNIDGTEAVLKRAGALVPVNMPTADAVRVLNWAVPNVNQCKGCHAQGREMVPIGPTAWNLGPSRLRQWSSAGLLRGVPSVLPNVPRWDDAAAPVADRARAYLAVNCAHCHSPRGPASNSGLFLDFGRSDRVATGIGKRPVAAGRGSGNREFSIVPGQPDQSILVYRMESTEPGVLMPELGRTLAHAEGVALVRAYITALPTQ